MSKVRCNVCGHEFEHTGPNALDTAVDVLSGISKFTAALTGNIFTMAAADNVAKNSEYKVKCPNCHSTNVTAVFENSMPVAAASTVTVNPNASIDALLKRAALFLEDEEWDTANVYYDQILDADPENSLAYLGKMMAELNCHCQEELQNCEEPFDDNANYQKALRFGSEAQKTTLLRYNEAIKARNERDRKDAIYLAAVRKMQEATKEEDFLQVITELQKVSGWKDADEAIAICKKSIDELRVQNEQKAKRSKKIALIAAPFVIAIIVAAVLLNNVNKYNNAIDLMEAGQYEEAAEILSELGDYKDSNEKLKEALEAVKLMEMEESYQAVLELLAENTVETHQTAYQMLLKLDDYKDAKEILSDFQLLKSYWEFNSGKSHIQETYQYSSSGYQVTDTHNGEETSYTYKFNEQGQLLEKRGQNNYLQEYRYHPNGEMAYSSYPAVSEYETHKYIGFYEAEYDTHGMPISWKYKEKNTYENQWNWDYHYREDGSIISVDIRYQNGQDEGFLTVDLESQGLEIVVDETGFSLPKYRSVSEDGKTEMIYTVAWRENELVLSMIETMEYDDHHNVIVQTYYSSNAEPSTYTYQYTYDEKGQKLSCTNDWGGTTEYTYDEYGNCIEKITRDAEGNITETEKSRYDYFYTPNAQ